MKLPIDEFSASMGLPLTPKIRFLNQKIKGNRFHEEPNVQSEDPIGENLLEIPTGSLDELEDDEDDADNEDDEVENSFLIKKQTPHGEDKNETNTGDVLPVTRIVKKKKLKINFHRPAGTRVVFDEEGNTLPPLATIADVSGGGSPVLDTEKVNKRYAELREEMKLQDKEDKLLERQRRKEKRMKENIKLKRGREEEEEDEDGDNLSGLDREATSGQKTSKKSKIYFDSDSDDGEKKSEKDKMGFSADFISLALQEELALKLLSSMNK